MPDLKELGAVGIARGVREGKVRAEEVLDAALERAKRLEPKLHCFLEVWESEARSDARRVDAAAKAGAELGPLAGVPVVLKDNMLCSGRRTECGSKILSGYVAPYDSTVVTRLKAAGAVLFGRANMDEFAMGSSTENSSKDPTRNPWDPERVPGGSSGGSAASVASGIVPLALGSDTGGSIRQPAALCGIFGLKPTYGLVSRYGLVAFASSLDQIGPLARSTADAALALSAIAGHDPRDSTSAPAPPRDFLKDLEGPVRGLKLGLPKECFGEGLEPEVENAVREAVKTLESLGATVREVSLPHLRYGIATYYILAPSEASANLARFDGVRYGPRREGGTLVETYAASRGDGFGPEVKRRIMLGTYALSSGYYEAYYGKAQRVRTLVRKDFEDLFSQVDVVLTPTSPTAAFKLGEKSDDPLQMYLSDVFTIPANLAGLPGLSVPCGFTKAGLPVGLQLMAPAFEEARLLRTAARYEEATEWSKRRPSLS